MSRYAIGWHRRAQADLLALYDWIADRAGPDTALAYTSGLEDHAGRLADYPRRGTSRDDLLPGLRTLVYRRRTIIAYRIDQQRVEILRLFHAGQDIAAAFGE